MASDKRKCPEQGCNVESIIQNFCTRHGRKLVKVIYPKCPCGDDVWPYQAFCGMCGRPASEAVMPTSVEAVV